MALTLDDFLANVGTKAVSFLLHSSLSVASRYAYKGIGDFISSLPASEVKTRLSHVHLRLATHTAVISPALDLIELMSMRGNTLLSNTLELTRALRTDMDQLVDQLQTLDPDSSPKALEEVEQSLDGLLARIEEALPLISLALTTSGANLSAGLPHTVSPSRLLKASQLVHMADTVFDGTAPVKVGSQFTLKLYTIFWAVVRNTHVAGTRNFSWREDLAKCQAQVYRVPASQEYQYELRMVEDFDDNRYHDDEQEPEKRMVSLAKVTRLFFSVSGQMLEIDCHCPVLVLKLNPMLGAQGPIEWLGLQVYDSSKNSHDLSILEYLIRLCALQSCDQKPMTEIADERISLYLRDEHAPVDAYSQTPEAMLDPSPLRPQFKARRIPPATPYKGFQALTPWETDRLNRVLFETPSKPGRE